MDLLIRGVAGLLNFNERTINRRIPPPPGPLDPADFAWVPSVEAAWPAIRAEVDALIDQGVRLPEIGDVTGVDQGNVGPWTTYILCSYGTWLDFNCERCPRTAEAVREIPGLQIAGLSVLEGGTHLPRHRGPNKGALRYQLGIRVPEPAGSCRIQVGNEMFVWDEHKSLIFDHTVHHEAWNDSDESRYVLFVELRTPLPRGLDLLNRMTQRVFSLAARGMEDRVRELDAALNA